MKTFNYRRSFKIINWGCSFDSLLEMKYAIFIHKDHEYVHAHIPIYYDPRTRFPTNYIRDNIRRYTPDFLIRNKITRKAFLVEIKPRAFENDPQLLLRKEVAENYIRWKKYDWKFKVVFDDEIKLSNDEHAHFVESMKLIQLSARKLWFKEFNDRFDCSHPSLCKKPPSNKQIHFVMFGDEKHFNEVTSTSVR